MTQQIQHLITQLSEALQTHRDGVAEGSCNHTREGEYCPEHGLMECGMHESMGGTVAGAVATGVPHASKGVREAAPETNSDTHAGLKSWQVMIMNNYYTGKYPDYSGRAYYVVATSPEQARQVVLDNADGILQDILTKKLHNGRRVLPARSAVPITPDRVRGIKPGIISTAGHKMMFGPQGPMMVKLWDGAVVDVQGQEQNVAEAEYDSRKPYGVRYRVFAGRDGRLTTKEFWTTSSEKLKKAVAKIEALGNFYEIDGYSYPKEKPGVSEDSTDPMDHRGAVTDSFRESLDRIKTLAQIRKS